MSEQTLLRTKPIVAKPMLNTALPRPAIAPVAHGVLQRCSNGVECADCRAKHEQQEGTLQRAAVNATPMPAVPPIVHDVLNSPGQPLDAATRGFMEPRFGHDFSGVRVHTDARAAESARAVNALAYTVGRNVVFGTGHYIPETFTGKKLLAHELTHVVQQNNQNSPQNNLKIGPSYNSSEQEANHIASRIVDGSSTTSSVQLEHTSVQPAWLQRASDDATNISTQLSTPRFKGNAVLEACNENRRLLKSGDPDIEAIKIVQKALIDAGFPLNTFDIDGKFGKETKSALEQFQVSVGLTGHDVDGIIGPITMHLLDQRFASENPQPGQNPRPSLSQQPVKVPAQLDIKTLRAGQVPDSIPETVITPTTFRDMVPDQPGSNLPGDTSRAIIVVEVGAEVSLFSAGDKIDPNKPDPCRRASVNTQLHTNFKLDGIGIGKRVHILYHDPTWTLTLPGPCGQLPEIKSEVDLLNIGIVPEILEFALKPALTFADGQLKPGIGFEAEFKPFAQSNSFLSRMKFTLGVDATSEKDADSNKRVLKTGGTVGAAIEF